MIRHIVAHDSNRGIGKAGVQPWKLVKDEAYFSEQTKQHGGIVLMGSTTYEVIGHALPGRENFVLSRDPQYEAPGATVIHDLDAFLDRYPDVWVIGGGAVYRVTMEQASELYITEIDADYDCDVVYPEYTTTFQLTERSDRFSEHGVAFRFCKYIPFKP